ncbi:dual specificity protein phosphatase family protein [Chelatococcus asaccharovorans]|nr:dual specificity protein phosphatase family protein [Chelatococcus asaccharovorans]
MRMTMATAAHSLTEEQEDRIPVLFPILGSIEPYGSTLFIGNRVAADDPELLQQNDITATMNLAVNIELEPLMLGDGTSIRRTHIGLIDGPGNRPQHLLAAVLALDGVLGQLSPGKPHYPAHRRGNVLVHCRGGRSRSVTVVALYLHMAHPERFRTFDDALEHVRRARGLDTTQPQPAMLALAQDVLARVGNLPLLMQR